LSDKDYEDDWLKYWISFCSFLGARRSQLRCEPKKKRSLDLSPRGDQSHITVRCAISRGSIAAELTLRGPKQVSNRNFDLISAKYRSQLPHLDWNRASENSESHILASRSCDPLSKSDRMDQHKWMMDQVEQFRAWMREFGI
jgi:hypothetical protein